MDPISLMIASLISGAGEAGTAIAGGLGDAATGIGSALSSGASALGDAGSSALDAGKSALGLGGGPGAAVTPPVGAPAATDAASSPGLWGQLNNGIKSVNDSPLGKMLGSMKPGAAPEPKYSGGFQGPQVSQAQSSNHPSVTQAVTSAGAGAAAHRMTLGQLLAESTYGQLRR